MATFPAYYKPVYPAEKIVLPNVRNVSFQRGGVYGKEERSVFGINSNRATWNITFVQRIAEGAEIYDFLLARKLDREYFDWTAPDSSISAKWKCDEFNKEIFDHDAVRINATFIECFEPPKNTAWSAEGIVISQAAPVATLTAAAGDGGTWTPAQLTTSLWLDFADTATVTTSGGSITQINDKSGNNRDAAQANSSKQPTTGTVNSRTCMVTTSGQSLQLASRLATVRCFVAVIQHTAASTGDYQFIVGDSDGYDFHSTTGNLIIDNIYSSLSIRNGSAWVNGSSVAPTSTERNTNTSCYIFNTTGNVTIRNFSEDRNLGRSTVGKTCEIIALSSTLSESDRQKLEGYLAHKWGFASSLPTGHPYRSAPP